MKALKIRAAVFGGLAALALSVAPLAHASLLLFSWSSSVGNVTWNQLSNPTPASVDAPNGGTVIDVMNMSGSSVAQNVIFGGVDPLTIEYYESGAGGGFDNVFGDQIFSGTLAAPIFAPSSSFAPFTYGEGGTGTLVITAVPEPQTLADFGMGLIALSLLVGWEAKRRRRPSDVG